MTNSYKRQTKDVTFKSRKVVDESKQLYKEDALKTQNEKSFLLDMDKSNLQYAKALDTWDKSEAKKYQEKIDFADQVSPALKQFLSKDLPALATIHHEGQVKKGEQNWDELDEETKLKYKYQNSQLLIKQKELVDQKISLADLAEKSGFKDYASFLRNQTKTARTAVFIKLAKESVAGLPGELKNAFADTTTQYTDIEGNTFTAADIDKVPALREDRINRIMAAVVSKNKLKSEVTGISKNMIDTAIGDEIDKAKAFQIKTLDQENLARTATANTKDTAETLTNALASLIPNSTESGLTFASGPDGELNPIIEYLPKVWDSLVSDAIKLNKTDPQAYAANQIAKVFQEVIAKADDKEEMKDFLQQLMGYAGQKVDGITILMPHRDGTSADLTLADLDSNMFGAKQAWTGENDAGSTQITGDGGLNNGEFDETVISNNTNLTIGENAVVKWKPDEKFIEENKELFVNGQLNPKWKDYWQYKLELEKASSINGEVSDQTLTALVDKMKAAGVTDQNLLNSILNFNTNKNAVQTELELYQTGGIHQFIRGKKGSQEIKLSDLDSYDRATVLKILAKDEFKDVKKVDKYYGEESKEAIGSSELAVYNAVTNNGQNDNVSTNKIVELMNTEIQSIATSEDALKTYSSEADRIDFATKAVLNEFNANKDQKGHDWYIDPKGNKVKGEGYPGRSGTTKEVMEKNEFELNKRIEKIDSTEDLGDKSFSSQVLVLNDKDFKAVKTLMLGMYDTRFGSADSIPIYIRKAALERGEWPVDFYNNQVKLYNIQNNLPPETGILAETQFMTQLKQNWSIPSYREYIELASTAKKQDGKILPNIELLRKLDQSLLRMVGKNNLPPETNISHAVTALEIGENKSVIETEDPDNSLIGRFGLRESDVKEYYKAKGLTYKREDFLNNGDLQKEVATYWVSKISGELRVKGVTGDQYNGGWGPFANSRYRKNNVYLVRQLEHRLREGSYYAGSMYKMETGLSGFAENRPVVMRSNSFTRNYLNGFSGGQD